jgi:hypothetical protein
MRQRNLAGAAAVLLTGFLAGMFAASSRGPVAASAQTARAGKTAAVSISTQEFQKLKSDAAKAKNAAGDQAHAMTSVAYHFNNLWFAGEHGNWPLAQFYFGETRSHLRWAVRIIPVRKDAQGREVKLTEILKSVENTPLKQVEEAIKAQDRTRFAKAYAFTLQSCYACHKTVAKPYLRLRIPTQPSEHLIDFDPPQEAHATAK